MQEMKVKSLVTDWRVREVKISGNIKYYLLVNIADKEKRFFKGIKESFNAHEKFTGKMMKIKDEKKEFTRTVLAIFGKVIKEEEITEPYVYNIDDCGIPTFEDMKNMFGQNVDEVRILSDDGQEQVLYYFKTAKKAS